MSDKILLLDGNSLINRAFYAMPLLTNKNGEYTNGVYGFLNIFFKLFDEEKPDYCVVCFDVHKPTFRHIEYKEYKGTRKGMPFELVPQMDILKKVLKSMNIAIMEMGGFEADDLLGTLATKAERVGIMPVIVSGDRDLLQLASDNIKIRIPKTKSGTTTVEDYNAKEVIDTYGVTPKEFIEVKALMGDSSDNVPGVPSIGEKTAIKIIQQYKTVENAIENAKDIKPKKASENLIEFKEQALM
ncbi:MAG: 5'-3' exonuclease H3TH domain-containing protein, partial [Lachnospirales bacterium]